MRGELGCCQFLMGVLAAESCRCADEGHQQGVQRRLTAAAGPTSLGCLAWKPSVSCQRSPYEALGAERVVGSWQRQTFDIGHWKGGGGTQQLLATVYGLLEVVCHHN